MSCEQPLRVKKYTMKFQEVNPNPYGLEFHADTAYYFICKYFQNVISKLFLTLGKIVIELFYFKGRVLAPKL